MGIHIPVSAGAAAAGAVSVGLSSVVAVAATAAGAAAAAAAGLASVVLDFLLDLKKLLHLAFRLAIALGAVEGVSACVRGEAQDALCERVGKVGVRFEGAHATRETYERQA